MERTHWERVGDRAERVGVLEAIENPLTVVTVVAMWTWGAALNSVIIAGVYFRFDELVPGAAVAFLVVVYIAGWFLFVRTGLIRMTFGLLAGTSLVVVGLCHVVLGGYANSGAFFFWAVGISMVFVLLLPRAVAIAVGIAVVTAAIVFGFLEGTLQAGRSAPDPALSSFFFAYTLVALVLLLAPVVGLLVTRLRYERRRAEGLLLNVLPAEVAAELKETGGTKAKRFDAVSVLFADIVGFTPMTEQMEPEEMVVRLNEVFTYFDSLSERYGVEKIRTIGDNYMVAAGVPIPRADHAHVLCAMALDMMTYAESGPLTFRIGINSGPAVAGVIGTSKFQYDIWGDTVNVASRMESHGEPGRIQISQTTYQTIKDDYAATPRGPVDVKGKGTLTTWWLESKRIQTKTSPMSEW